MQRHISGLFQSFVLYFFVISKLGQVIIFELLLFCQRSLFLGLIMLRSIFVDLICLNFT